MPAALAAQMAPQSLPAVVAAAAAAAAVTVPARCKLGHKQALAQFEARGDDADHPGIITDHAKTNADVSGYADSDDAYSGNSGSPHSDEDKMVSSSITSSEPLPVIYPWMKRVHSKGDKHH